MDSTLLLLPEIWCAHQLCLGQFSGLKVAQSYQASSQYSQENEKKLYIWCLCKLCGNYKPCDKCIMRKTEYSLSFIKRDKISTILLFGDIFIW